MNSQLLQSINEVLRAAKRTICRGITVDASTLHNMPPVD
ncbi:hypothetical protein SAMN05443287_106209 [Micromonospora phaseoli]|uniref:Uncharacterized protein n=1 Tax=Micromonospora phaseoli TaxID=1144548 RepID=A0A1H7AL57_9ACTN|nr:hypothetical protein CLV64_107180 [Micromonospora phaseoli]SEJ66381.1 hypothetical protein SAMN05443287_106209 [Micromonospora phaseoli]